MLGQNGQFQLPQIQGLPVPQQFPVPPFATAEGVRNFTMPLESIKTGLETSLNSVNSAMMNVLQAIQAPFTHHSPQPLVAPLDAFIRTVKSTGLPLPMPDAERMKLEQQARIEGIDVPVAPPPAPPVVSPAGEVAPPPMAPSPVATDYYPSDVPAMGDVTEEERALGMGFGESYD